MRNIFDQDHTIPVQNPTYPMANLKSSAYAAPLTYNRPTEALGGYDAQVNPMTGQEMPQTNFARGGKVDDFTSALHDGMAAYAGGGAVQHFKAGDKVASQDMTMYTGSMIPGLKPIGASNIEGANSPHAMTGDGLSPEQIEMLGSYVNSVVGANKELPANELQKALAAHGVDVSLGDIGKAFASAGYQSYGTVTPGLVETGSGQAISTPSDAGQVNLGDLARSGVANVAGGIAQGAQNVAGGLAGSIISGGNPLAGLVGANLASKNTGFADWVRNLISGIGKGASSSSSSSGSGGGDAVYGYDERTLDPNELETIDITGDWENAVDPNQFRDLLDSLKIYDFGGVDRGTEDVPVDSADDLEEVVVQSKKIDDKPVVKPVTTTPVIEKTEKVEDPDELEEVVVQSKKVDDTKPIVKPVTTTPVIEKTEKARDPDELEEVVVQSKKIDDTKPVVKPVTTTPVIEKTEKVEDPDELEEVVVQSKKIDDKPVVKPVTTTPVIEKTIVDPGYTGAEWQPTIKTDDKVKTGTEGVITTTTAGGVQDQPHDTGVPKEGAGAGTATWGGIPLFKSFQSAYDPMYSASTSERYGGSAAQNLQDYMASLNQSLRPGPITPYTFQTAPERVATPQTQQGVASLQSAPSRQYQVTQPSRRQAEGIASVSPTMPTDYAYWENLARKDNTPIYANPVYDTTSQGFVSGKDPNEQVYAHGGIAYGGLGSLPGTYKAGGKLLRGPGDGMSDSIPAVIHGKQTQRAALADGEFVIPADVVSHLGNGSTDAGARKLYAMMNKIRQARTGRTRQAPEVSADRYMPKA